MGKKERGKTHLYIYIYIYIYIFLLYKINYPFTILGHFIQFRGNFVYAIEDLETRHDKTGGSSWVWVGSIRLQVRSG